MTPKKLTAKQVDELMNGNPRLDALKALADAMHLRLVISFDKPMRGKPVKEGQDDETAETT